MKLAIVIGTRPEIIKMAPVIRECQKRGVDFFIVHSNQHYSREMDAVFFEELELPAPDYNLNVGSGPHGNQTGNILVKMEPIFQSEKPDFVLVQGDTNTVLAAAMAASKLQIPVGHIEAGLRSYDRTMPEETNRVITDHIATYRFTVTQTQTQTLNQEGITQGIFPVGNTVADSLIQHISLAETKSSILKNLDLNPKGYALLTAHRAGNVDREGDLINLLDIVGRISQNLPVVWPMHLRTRKFIEKYGLSLPDTVTITDPLGYLDFILLEKHAKVIVTDSGGLQEEACILGVPCITLRENTERPETLEVGANKLVGLSIEKAMTALDWALGSPPLWKQPFGEGNTSQHILDILHKPSIVLRKVNIVGLGYMGLPTASLLASAGHQVWGVDLNKEKIEILKRGQSPLDEPGIQERVEEALASGQLKVGLEPEPADIFIIAVPTPVKDRACDLTFVLSAADSVASVAKDGDIVILESTVKPGTCRDILRPFFEKKGLKLRLAHCPERAIPGQTYRELVHNDRIIGADSKVVQEEIAQLYRSFVQGQIFFTDTTTAEMAKLMENTFRDVNIALANELEILAREIGVNINEAISLANRHPRVNILSPGPGVGGHCIPIDPWFLIENSQEARLIPTARELNDHRPHLMVERLHRHAQENGISKIGLLGVAYKPDVDDARETPALPIVRGLLELGYEVRVHDPFVKGWDFGITNDLEQVRSWADICIVVTQHSVYKALGIRKIQDL